MPNHDRYETDILKTLQRIAGALESIDKTLKDKNTAKSVKEEKHKGIDFSNNKIDYSSYENARFNGEFD